MLAGRPAALFTGVCIALFAPTAGASTRGGDAAPHGAHAAGRLIVRASAGASVDGLRDDLAARGFSLGARIPHTRFFSVSIGGRTAPAAIRALAGDSAIVSATADHVRHAFEIPNDPFFDPAETYLSTVRLPQAWDLTHGSPTLTIAVLDTGVSPVGDLATQVLAGRNFVAGNTDARDDSTIGHGTLVAGVAAATTNNGIGIAGAAWSAGVLPVKVLDARGLGTDSQVASGIVWAVDHGARIVNLSLGGHADGPALCEAVSYATSNGVLVVASAGNNGTDAPNYPAACPGALAIAATDANGDFASFSNFGPDVSLAAPGVAITSTRNNNTYGTESGTSFSAPLVAGTAALTMSQHPDWSAEQVASHLEATAQDRGPAGVDPYYGHGLLDAYAASGGPAQEAVVPTGDMLEPNDSAADASSLYGDTTATISPEGDVDWYLVRIRWPCLLTFVIDGPPFNAGLGPNFQPELQLYDEDSNLLARRDDAPAGRVRFAVRVPAGRYYLRVANRGGSRSPDAYSVTASKVRLHRVAMQATP